MGATLYLEDLATARRTAEWVGARRALKVEGRFSLVWGALAVVQGIAGFAGSVLMGPMVGLGLFLIVAGAWAARKPSPRAMRAELIAWWFVVSWNLLLGLLLVAMGLVGQSDALAAAVMPLLFGGVQVYWAIQATHRYRRYCALALAPPPAQAVSEMEAMVDQLTALKHAQAPDSVEITTAGFGDGGGWRARLAERWALFVDRGGRAIAIASPAELEVVDRGERLISHSHRTTVKFGKRRIAGTISPESLSRLQGWKEHALVS
jgi:hypothetical protein